MKLTNSVARKLLGEAGFIETNIDVYATIPDHTQTVWDRNGYQVVLNEHRDGIKDPFLYEYATNKPISINNLGYRNVNIKGGK